MGIKGGCDNPKCSVSTGYHDGLTFGWGKLDDHGYWEHPCPTCARAWEAANPDDAPCWPFEKKTENTNCLAGIKCPKCGALEPFDISARTNVVMSDDGSDPDESHGDLEWDNDSDCLCLSCRHRGKVGDFRTSPTTASQTTPKTKEDIAAYKRGFNWASEHGWVDEDEEE